MTGGPIFLTVEMTGEMTTPRSYNVRENYRRFDRWTNSSVDPKILVVNYDKTFKVINYMYYNIIILCKYYNNINY